MRTKDQRRAASRAEWDYFKQQMRLEAKLLDEADRTSAGAVERGEMRSYRSEWVHFALTLLTAGLWGPVWLWVAVRNHRRYGQTSVGRAANADARTARRGLRASQRARRRGVAV